MSLPADRPLPRWGDRTALLAKEMSYAFSLSVTYKLELGTSGQGVARLVAQPATDGPSTFHVLDRTVVVDGGGGVNEVPRAHVVRGDDILTLSNGGAGSLDGRLFLETEHGARLCIAYSGVLNLRGGQDILRRNPPALVDGTAFIATRHECPRPNLRWLVRCQLFGFGRVRVQPRGKSVEFAFDLYAAA